MFKRFHNLGEYLPGTINQKLVERRHELEEEAETARNRRYQERLFAKAKLLNPEPKQDLNASHEKMKEPVDLPSGSAVFTASSPFKKDEHTAEGSNKDSGKNKDTDVVTKVSKDKETEPTVSKPKLVAEGDKLKVTTAGGGKGPKEFVVYTNRPSKNKKDAKH